MMSSTKFEQVHRLMAARLVREGELNAAREVEDRARVRRMSLEAAVEELDKTIRTIIGDEHVPDAATPILERQAESYDADRRTLAERIVDHLAASRCPLDALAISQAIGVENINV